MATTDPDTTMAAPSHRTEDGARNSVQDSQPDGTTSPEPPLIIPIKTQHEIMRDSFLGVKDSYPSCPELNYRTLKGEKRSPRSTNRTSFGDQFLTFEFDPTSSDKVAMFAVHLTLTSHCSAMEQLRPLIFQRNKDAEALYSFHGLELLGDHESSARMWQEQMRVLQMKAGHWTEELSQLKELPRPGYRRTFFVFHQNDLMAYESFDGEAGANNH
ncbi:MAG: hypothetical protein Q9221_004626 [Calogaya cf. arnoldii]